MTGPAPSASTWPTPRTWWWTAGAVLVGTVVAGLSYWSVPYDQLNADDVAGPLLALGLVPVILLRASGIAPFLLTVAAGAAVAVGVVAVRVAVDVSTDPTSHNLWPFEIVIAGMIGLVAGLVAAAVGELLLRLRRA
jgi:hypothetical protein